MSVSKCHRYNYLIINNFEKVIMKMILQEIMNFLKIIRKKWSCKRTDVKNKIKSFELINIISRIKTSLSGVNSRLEMAEERSNDPKDQLTEIIYSEQDKEKRFFQRPIILHM